MVDFLPRAGADEKIVDDNGKKAIDVIRRDFQGGDWLDEDDKRMRQLLADAPADRAGVAEVTWSCVALTRTECSRRTR